MNACYKHVLLFTVFAQFIHNQRLRKYLGHPLHLQTDFSIRDLWACGVSLKTLITHVAATLVTM